MQKQLYVTHRGKEYTVQFRGRYSDGTKVILIEDTFKEPYLTATTYAHFRDIDTENEVVIKDYAENSGILRALIDAGILYEPHSVRELYFVKVHICKIKRQS